MFIVCLTVRIDHWCVLRGNPLSSMRIPHGCRFIVLLMISELVARKLQETLEVNIKFFGGKNYFDFYLMLIGRRLIAINI